MDSSKPLIVVVGLGAMGTIHASNLSKQRSIRLGLASGRSQVLSKISTQLNAEYTYNSLESVLEDKNVSAIVLATPPPAHPNQIILAAQAGKHIFCEKPLGYNLTEINNAHQIVNNSKIRFMTGFMRRWDPGYYSVKQRMDSGEYGKPIVFKCTSGDPEYPEKYIRPNAGAENALYKDLGVHDIDLARWYTNSEVDSVCTCWDAYTYERLKKVNDGDNAMGMMKMKNGTVVLFHFSRAFDYGYNSSAELVATKGTLRVGELHRIDVTTMKQKVIGKDIVWEFGERFDKAFENEMIAFTKLVCAKSEKDANDLINNDQRYAGFEDGLVATKVALALVRSSEVNGMVEVDYS